MNSANTFYGVGDTNLVSISIFTLGQVSKFTFSPPVASLLFRDSPLRAIPVCKGLVALSLASMIRPHSVYKLRSDHSKRPPIVPDSFRLLPCLHPGGKILPSLFTITKPLFLSMSEIFSHQLFRMRGKQMAIFP